jgi:hypothetical protein
VSKLIIKDGPGVVRLVFMIQALIIAACAGEPRPADDDDGGGGETRRSSVCQRLCGAVQYCYESGYPDSELAEMSVDCESQCSSWDATIEELESASACMDTANSCEDYDDVCDIF